MNARWRSLGWLLVTASVTLSGCASTKRDLRAGDYWPSGARWKQSTVRALKDPGTWVPAAGAVVISIDDWDGRITDWAVDNTPLFGSAEDAGKASDYLLAGTNLSMVGTALAVPNGPGAWEFKLERVVLEELGVLLTAGLTDVLKDVTGRERPDGANDRSFPSGHTSQAFTASTLAGRNVDQLKLSKSGRLALKSTFTAMAAATAWARVEAGVHYPSDLFAGAALGNFIAIFIHDAFLPADSETQLSAFIDRREVALSVSFRFGAGAAADRKQFGEPRRRSPD
jgi:membrane-associated phospholipid phosphatase